MTEELIFGIQCPSFYLGDTSTISASACLTAAGKGRSTEVQSHARVRYSLPVKRWKLVPLLPDGVKADSLILPERCQILFVRVSVISVYICVLD